MKRFPLKLSSLKAVTNKMMLNRKNVKEVFEVAQYSLIGFWIAIVIGVALDAITSELNEESPLWLIGLEISIHLVFLAVTIFYIKKALLKIPFVFKFGGSYVQGKSDAVTFGLTTGVGLVFAITQVKLKNKMLFIKDKITNQLPIF